MAWIEMTRKPLKRPTGWRVGECLWSPRRNPRDGKTWGFWETMRRVQPGDVVFHLCGRWPNSAFTGFSTASSSVVCLEEDPTGVRPIYRVDLADFEPLDKPLPLPEVFAAHDQALRTYFAVNRDKKKDKERLFYVLQSRRLQCLNGAYLSELSPALLDILFGLKLTTTAAKAAVVAGSATTGTALAEAARRIGHREFAENVKNNFSLRCCFPGCKVDDRRFLIGAHIARWADHPELRGDTNNGLCLCLYHDKAFEMGAFTLDHRHRVIVAEGQSVWLKELLEPGVGQSVATCQIAPSLAALSLHWAAHGFKGCAPSEGLMRLVA